MHHETGTASPIRPRFAPFGKPGVSYTVLDAPISMVFFTHPLWILLNKRKFPNRLVSDPFSLMNGHTSMPLPSSVLFFGAFFFEGLSGLFSPGPKTSSGRS